ncbi:MAG: hypothetical protein WA324_26425, partial [Bryobacteraceae bacterium]
AVMQEHWGRIKLQTEDIAKLAVGQKKYGPALTPWESILSEIIVGDAFGADRIDYLLRDSHHAGVAYGRFDQNRLIDTLRILPKERDSSEPTLGVEEGDYSPQKRSYGPATSCIRSCIFTLLDEFTTFI